MSSTFNFILKLQDMLSPGMIEAARIAETAAKGINGRIVAKEFRGEQMNASLGELQARLKAVRKVMKETVWGGEFDVATKSARMLEGQIARLQGRQAESSKKGGGLFGDVSLGGVFSQVKALGSKALGLAMDQEQHQLRFEKLTGSRKSGDKMLTNIMEMDASTSFNKGDLMGAAETLKKGGVSNEQVMPRLQMLGEVSGGDAQKLDSLTKAYAKITETGRMTKDELNMLEEAGFNPLETIARQTGLSMDTLTRQMNKGGVSAGMVNNAFQAATGPGGEFHDVLKKQSQTLGGRWGSLMDRVDMKLLALGELIKPLAGMVVDFGNSLMQGELPAIAIATAIGAVTLALGYNAVVTNATSIATKGLAISQTIMNAVMNANPIILIIGLLIALGIWIYSICRKYEGWSAAMMATWSVIKGFAKLALLAFKELGEGIAYYIEYGWLKFKSFGQWIGIFMNQLAVAVGKMLRLDFKGAKEALTQEIITPADRELKKLEAQHNARKKEFAQQRQEIGAGILKNLGNINLVKKAEEAKAGTAGSPDLPKTSNKGEKTTATGESNALSVAKNNTSQVSEGGQRNITIHVHKMAGVEQMHVMSAGEGMSELESMVQAAVRRTIYSLNNVAA